MVSMLLLNRDRSLSLCRVSKPSILEMLLKERSSHCRFVRCSKFWILEITLLSN